MENPKDATYRLLGVISEFGKVGEKVNTQKSVAFLHRFPCFYNEQSEKEMVKTILFTPASKGIRYL